MLPLREQAPLGSVLKLDIVQLLEQSSRCDAAQPAQEATVVAGRAAVVLGDGHELIDLGGGQVVAVAHRFIYCWGTLDVRNTLKIKGAWDGYETWAGPPLRTARPDSASARFLQTC